MEANKGAVWIALVDNGKGWLKFEHGPDALAALAWAEEEFGGVDQVTLENGAAQMACDKASEANAAIKDSDGNALEIGATYCCALDGFEGEKTYGDLVVFAGTEKSEFIAGEPVDREIFLDADSMEEVSADWDSLVRQHCPIRQLEVA